MHECKQRLFESVPMKIGKHFWRIIVGEFDLPISGLRNCTHYEWHTGDGVWKSMEKWPSCNGDRYDGGLPKTLRKLYEQNREAVERLV